MNIFTKLQNISSAPKSIFLDCSATPQSTWVLNASNNTLKLHFEVDHTTFVVWLKSLGIEHDINCDEYSIEI
jgi:hypothetical protein